GHHVPEVVKQEPFRAADVEDPVAGFEPVEIAHALGDGNPAAVVAVAAVALAAVAVEVFTSEAARDRALRGDGRLARGDVALHARVAVEEVDLAHARALRIPGE